MPKDAENSGEKEEKVQSMAEYLGLVSPKAAEEEEEDPQDSPHAYSLYRSQRGGPGVEIFLPDGAVYALPYHQVMEIVTNPEATLLVIHCNAGHLFAVHGRHLGPLRTSLMLGRVRFIKAHAQGPDNIAVQEITLEQPSPEE